MAKKTSDSLKKLSSDFQDVDHKYRQVLLTLFARLKVSDPDLAALALEAFGKPKVAAEWFATPHRDLHGKAPFKGLGEGKRQIIWNAVGRFISGSYG